MTLDADGASVATQMEYNVGVYKGDLLVMAVSDFQITVSVAVELALVCGEASHVLNPKPYVVREVPPVEIVENC